jgi:predicted Holliday junction resolvase-like endonuclease
MSTQTEFLIFFVALSIILFLLWRKAVNRISLVKFQKQSLSTKYGKITEQFLPFLDAFPHDPSGFRFIGSPIDGIQFEEDQIIFYEFKSGGSRLTQKQNQIKKIINDGNIYFKEIYLR